MFYCLNSSLFFFLFFFILFHFDTFFSYYSATYSSSLFLIIHFRRRKKNYIYIYINFLHLRSLRVLLSYNCLQYNTNKWMYTSMFAVFRIRMYVSAPLYILWIWERFKYLRRDVHTMNFSSLLINHVTYPPTMWIIIFIQFSYF